LAIYGDIDIDAAKKSVEKQFAAVRKTNDRHTKPKPLDLSTGNDMAVPSIVVDRVEVQQWDNPESAVFIGFKSNSLIHDARRDPLIMADTLTSGYTYPTGYIFETLRGMGLVYEANAQNLWGLNDKLPGTFW